MACIPAVEFEHCRELALLPASVFEFTSRFLPAGKLEPVLALYALRRAVGSIPHGHADDSVKWAKLRWWSEELFADPAASVRHPVLRALWLSGARVHFTDSLLQQMVGDALSQIDAAPYSDEASMFERLAAIGSTEIQLELALEGAEIDSHRLAYLGAATGTFSLISSFAANHRGGAARLPLSVLAKYNVSVSELEANTHAAELAQIIERLAERSLEWFNAGMSDLKFKPAPSLCSHLQLRWAMEKRRLNEIRCDAPGFLAAGKRFGPADAWFAWRFLRKLK